ncbi:MAG: OmpA family protein [Cyclobacteriaceae bacterium]
MRSIITIVVILLAIVAEGQVVTLKTREAADRAFDKFSYKKAAELYKLSFSDSEDSTELILRIADCYRLTNQSDSVEHYLSMVAGESGLDAQYHYYYAESLLSNQKYDEATKWYEVYRSELENDNRTPLKLYALDHWEMFFKDSSAVSVSQVAFNSPGLDFSPTRYRDNLVFVSSRSLDKEWITNEFNWDDTRFLDLFKVDLSSGKVSYFDENIKSTLHEGPSDFYNDGEKLVFTRNNVSGKKIRRDDKGVTRLRVYFAEKTTDGWGNIKPFTHNGSDYSVGHPAISESGNVLIVTSDKSEGIGGTDLYISFLDAGEWSVPVNMGDVINSEGREMFPTLVDHTLYYSSDGLASQGGLDIFKIKLDEAYQPIGTPQNVGYPINSNRDDFGLITDATMSSGYFSSSRNEDQKDDIFYFERTKTKGWVLDRKSGLPIVGADVFLTVSETGEEYYRYSGKDGSFIIPRIDAEQLHGSSVKYGYEKINQPTVYSQSDTGSYVIFLDEIVPKVNLTFSDGISIDEFLDLGDSIGIPSKGTFDIEPIFYEYDESFLTNDAIATLREVLRFLQAFPEVRMELVSTTDFRGEDDYNFALSQRRANEAFWFLTSMGIDNERLVPHGYGTTRPFVNCEDCTEEEHRLNRRTEFVITAISSKK